MTTTHSLNSLNLAAAAYSPSRGFVLARKEKWGMFVREEHEDLFVQAAKRGAIKGLRGDEPEAEMREFLRDEAMQGSQQFTPAFVDQLAKAAFPEVKITILPASKLPCGRADWWREEAAHKEEDSEEENEEPLCPSRPYIHRTRGEELTLSATKKGAPLTVEDVLFATRTMLRKPHCQILGYALREASSQQLTLLADVDNSS